MKPLWHSCRKGGSRKTVGRMYFALGTVKNGRVVDVTGRLSDKPVWGCSRCGRAWGKGKGYPVKGRRV